MVDPKGEIRRDERGFLYWHSFEGNVEEPVTTIEEEELEELEELDEDEDEEIDEELFEEEVEEEPKEAKKRGRKAKK